MTTTVSITRATLRQSIPQHDGTVRLAGLDGPVEVVRDSLGIPHVKASSVHDVFFGQGFVHAQDRLWHMEYDRKRAAGRWAEYVGPVRRRSGQPDAAGRLATSAHADYAALNRRDQGHARRLCRRASTPSSDHARPADRVPPPRNQTPEPWEPWHSCAVFKVRHGLMGSLGNKLWRARILKTLGPGVGRAAAGRLRRRDRRWSSRPGATYADVPDGIGESAALATLVLALGDVDGGSNNWVVQRQPDGLRQAAAGRRSRTAPSTSRTSTTRTT